MGSTRLPGKSMMDLAGEPLVGRILERVKQCKTLDQIVLAIPNTDMDKPLAELANRYGIEVFEGSEDDLVDRYYKAAITYNASVVVRLPADNAAPEPKEIDRIVDYHLSLNRPGFSSNLSQVDGSGYPDGIGAEVFDITLLSDVWNTVTDAQKREHVHLNFYNYETGKAVDSGWCPVSTLQCPTAFCRPDLVLDVNTLEQYLFMKNLYESLYQINAQFTILDIIDWYDNKYRDYAKT